MRHLILSKKCSERQACRFVGLSRSTARYAKRSKADEAELVEHLKEFARKRHRHGYRLAHQELRRSGMPINHKRVHRLWCKAGLSVPARRTHKKIRTGKPAREVVADRANAVWCVDFVQDCTISGTKLRILSVTDEFTRQSLALEVGRSFKSERVCQILAELFTQQGVPAALRMDNGPEFIALALRGLCHSRQINATYIEPGKPWHQENRLKRFLCNGYAESFHARLRDEFLNAEVFESVLEAQVRLRVWRRYWNGERLHSSLGYLTPEEFAQREREKSQNLSGKRSETQATVGA